MTQAENSGHRRGLLLRLLVAGIVLALWFWTQSLIGARTAPGSGIGDALHNLTAGLNSYFARNSGAANALLIVSSALIDTLGFVSHRTMALRRKRSPVPRIVPAYDPASIDAGHLRVASASEHDLALSRVPLATGNLSRRQRFFLFRTYRHRGFRGDRAISLAPKLVHSRRCPARLLRGGYGPDLARALHHGRFYRDPLRHSGSRISRNASRHDSIICSHQKIRALSGRRIGGGRGEWRCAKTTAAISIGNKSIPAILSGLVAVTKDYVKKTTVSRISKRFRRAYRRRNCLSRFESGGAQMIKMINADPRTKGSGLTNSKPASHASWLRQTTSASALRPVSAWISRTSLRNGRSLPPPPCSRSGSRPP